MHVHALDRAHHALSRGALRSHPILYVCGEIVLHQEFGPCEVLKVQGARRRLIEYVHPLPMPKEKHLANLTEDTLMWAEESESREAWVDIDELRWLHLQDQAIAREGGELGFVRLAWLKTLDENTRSQYTQGVDYAELRFDRGSQG